MAWGDNPQVYRLGDQTGLTLQLKEKGAEWGGGGGWGGVGLGLHPILHEISIGRQLQETENQN